MGSETGIEGTKEYAEKLTISDRICIGLSIAFLLIAALVTWG